MGPCQSCLNPFISASTAFAIWLIYDLGPLDYCQDRSVVVAIRRASASSALDNFQKGAMLPLRPAECINLRGGSFACFVRVSTILVSSVYFLRVTSNS